MSADGVTFRVTWLARNRKFPPIALSSNRHTLCNDTGSSQSPGSKLAALPDLGLFNCKQLILNKLAHRVSVANGPQSITQHSEPPLTLRVDGDLAAPVPHRPLRARLTHSVLHSTVWPTVRYSDGPVQSPAGTSPKCVALTRPPRQPFSPDPPRPIDHGGHSRTVAGDTEISEVPLQHAAESMILSRAAIMTISKPRNDCCWRW